MLNVKHAMRYSQQLKHVDWHSIEMMKMQSTIWYEFSSKNGDIILTILLSDLFFYVTTQDTRDDNWRYLHLKI
jgi:hypothetical protein